MSAKPHVLELSSLQIKELFAQWKEPSFRAKQLVDWIYKKQVSDFDSMSNLSQNLRNRLKEELDFSLPRVLQRLDSQDGSSKLLLANHKNQLIETVILRYENRTSLCVSSQVGCKLACSFCQTGKLGFFSHLTQAEILGQMLRANEILRSEGKKVSHVVFMGMGEPLDNYKNAVAAANKMIEESYFNLSARHVTISSSGLAPQIEALAIDSKAALAISLHAADDALRTELMPINRKYSLDRLKQALTQYQKQTGKKITIEYILISQKNCGPKQAKDLVRFLHGLRAKVNLIPFNAHPGLPYDRPSDEEIRDFQKYLADRSIPAPVRYSKGLEVSAACGQLAAKSAKDIHSIPERKRVLESSVEMV